MVHRLEPNAMAQAFDHGLATRQVSFRNIGTFRRTVECEAAVLAAQERTDEHLVRLDAAIKDLRQSLQDPKRFLATDFELHAVIAQASGNPLYAITTEALTMTIKGMIYDGLCSITSLAEWKQILKTHEGIVEAIRERRPAACWNRARPPSSESCPARDTATARPCCRSWSRTP